MMDFRKWMRAQGYAPTTIRMYRNYVARALAHLGTLRGLTTADLERWLATLPPEAASRRAARKAMIVYYQHRGTRTNPAEALPVRPEPHRLPRPLGLEDFRAYIDAADSLGGEHRIVGFLFAYTAARFSEVRYARWTQFDLHGPSWRITGKGSGRRGAKERIVPLHPRLAHALRAWRLASTSTDYLVAGTINPWPSETTIRKIHADICEAADVTATPHTIRHSTLTYALDGSHDLRAVQELAGHGSIATTQGYTKVLPGRIESAVAALPT